jgi:hypothetical protein
MIEVLKQHQKTILWSVAIVFVVGLISIILHQLYLYHSDNKGYSSFSSYVGNSEIHFQFFGNNIGGFFVFLMGSFTVAGIILAIMQMREQKSIIINYPQLLEFLTKLLEDSKKGEIGIISYFPLPGYWQVNKSMSEDFYNALKICCDRIKMVCLTEEEHLSMLIDITLKGTLKFTKKDLRKKFKELYSKSEGLLQLMTKSRPTRKSFDALPHYFIFVAKKQAIIVTPTGLPKINPVINDYLKIKENYQNIVDMIRGSDNFNFDEMITKIRPVMRETPILAEETPVNSKNTQTTIEMERLKNSDGDKVLVQTLGFYTTDPSVIQRLWDIHKEHYHEPDNQND